MLACLCIYVSFVFNLSKKLKYEITIFNYYRIVGNNINLESFNSKLQYKCDLSWLKICDEWNENYPVVLKSWRKQKTFTNPYFFIELIEAGISLKGSEVKSLRDGKGSIADSYAVDSNGELFLINS